MIGMCTNLSLHFAKRVVSIKGIAFYLKNAELLYFALTSQERIFNGKFFFNHRKFWKVFEKVLGMKHVNFFGLYVFFTCLRPRGNFQLHLLRVMRAYTREKEEIWKKQFSRELSHDLTVVNKTYKLKRSLVPKFRVFVSRFVQV